MNNITLGMVDFNSRNKPIKEDSNIYLMIDVSINKEGHK
jgi:hypothetical protein